MKPSDVYTQPPTSVTANVWAEIGSTVCEIVASYCTHNPPPGHNQFKALRAAVTKHYAYCFEMGYDLDFAYIFHDEIIEQSVRSDSKSPRASMGTMRRHLKNIANELNPDFDGPRMYHRYERSDPNPPYTDKEVHDIWQWAQVKNNGKRTQMKQLIVACGLGAGLTAAEAGHLTYGDIEIDELGVQLHLPERTVPVLAEWDEVFRYC